MTIKLNPASTTAVNTTKASKPLPQPEENQQQKGVTAPRVVTEPAGDTYSKTDTDKNQPTVPVLIGAGTGVTLFGGGALALLPEKPVSKISELKAKDGVKGFLVIDDEQNTLTRIHDGFTYRFEKLDSGNLAFKDVYKAQLSPELADWEYIHPKAEVGKSPHATIVCRPVSSGTSQDNEIIQSLLTLNASPTSSNIDDRTFSIFVNEAGVHVKFKNRPDAEILSFLVEKGADGKAVLKESEDLKNLINTKIYSGIEQGHIDNLKKALEDPQLKVLEAFDALKTMKPPEAIENLVHTTKGKAWSIIGGLATVGLLLGAGIGYLLGKPKEAPAH